MAFRDWLNRLAFERAGSKGLRGSWPWITALAAVAFLLLVVWSGSLTAVAELVRALAALCWPALVYVVLRTYQEEIRGLLHRIRRVKPAPGELELRADLDRLEQQVRAESERMGARPGVPRADESEEAAAKDASEQRRILDAAARSPRLAIMELSLAIEQELRQLAAITGCNPAPGQDGDSVRGMADRLGAAGLMSRSLANSVVAFCDLRNRLVHAHAGHENEAIRAIDLGSTLWRIVRSISPEANPGLRLAEGGIEEVAGGV
jgi:hypothetical protein